MNARFARMLAVTAAIGMSAVVSTAVPAGAIGLTTFSMSPTSGPAGTEVSVSGAGCAPGLLLSGSLDRVVVTMAGVPPVSVQIPVTSSGAWSGTVTVPANAPAAPALVTPVCFTDGLQSLLTIYTPKTFTITSTAAPTTTTAPGSQPATTTMPERTQPPPVAQPPGTGSGPTPTTKPGSPRTTQPGDDGPTVGVPGDGPGSPGEGSPEPGSADGGGASTGGTTTASGKNAETVSIAADLQAPDLTSTSDGDGGSGLGWIGRLALLLLVVGAVAGALLFRRFRHEHAPAET